MAIYPILQVGMSLKKGSVDYTQLTPYQLVMVNEDGNALIDTFMRYDPATDRIISSKTLQVPSESLNVGQNVKLTDGGSGLGYVLEATGSTHEISGSLYSEAAGTQTGLIITEYPNGAFDVPTQPSDAETLTAEDYIWQAEISGINEDLLRVFTVDLRGAAGPQAPVRLRIYIDDPILNSLAVPIYDNVGSNELGWLNGDDGFELVDGQTTVLVFAEAQRLRANLPFFIRYTVPPGEQFSVAGATVDIGFGPVFVPYQISRVMGGYEREVFPLEFRSVSSMPIQYTNSNYDTAPITKLSETINVLAGQFSITLSATTSSLSRNRRVVVGLYIDGALQFDEYQNESKDVQDFGYPSKTFDRFLSEGDHLIEVKYGKRGGGGNSPVAIQDVNVSFTRIEGNV